MFDTSHVKYTKRVLGTKNYKMGILKIVQLRVTKFSHVKHKRFEEISLISQKKNYIKVQFS